MTISAASLKLYQCTTWTEGDTHGGAINTSAEITSGVANNIFDDVSSAERSSGDTEYRKVFFRNENADTYPAVKHWLGANTPATNDTVSIQLTGSKSVQGSDVACTGTATWASSTSVTTSDSLAGELHAGDKIFNSTDDTYSSAVQIASISGTTITLASAYGGTAGSGKGISVARATAFTYVAPDAKGHADVLTIGSLAQNESCGIWIKRVVTGGGSGYNDNTFTLSFEDS